MELDVTVLETLRAEGVADELWPCAATCRASCESSCWNSY
jgi:hypothetical protein